jgi:hypothetical protein
MEGKLRKSIIRACAVACLVFISVTHATNVSGLIGTNTTWNTAGNPYIVTGNIFVDSLVTLTIQPGVTVRIDSANYMMIKGTLNAIGTAVDSITITKNGSARWGRLWFKSVTKCSLKYCKIEYAGRSAIYNESTDLLSINYCTIDSSCSDNDDGGGIYNLGSALISNNSIINNTAGYYSGGGISNDGSATVINNTIAKNQSSGGGGICSRGTIVIANNIIAENRAPAGNGGGIGAGIGQTIITGNTISNNFATYGGGIFIYGGGAIKYNTITDTTPYAVFIHGGGGGAIRTNNIYATHYCAYSDAKINVDARYNYWNTTDSAVIAEKIFDFYDDFTIGKINYRHFLRQAFSDTVAPAPPLTLTGKTILGSALVISWTNPSDPSGISEYYYKIGDAPVSDFDTTGSFHGTPDTVHSAGGMLYVWLVDSSGNCNYHNNASVMLPRAGVRDSKGSADLLLSISLPSNRSLAGHVVQYTLPEKTMVGLTLLDLSGRLVRNLYCGIRERGSYLQTVPENELPAGVYFVRFQAGTSVLVRNYTVLR